MGSRVAFLLGAAMSAMACTVSGTGLAVVGAEADGSAAGRSTSGPAGFTGLPDDAGVTPPAPLMADASGVPPAPVTPPPMEADAAPAPTPDAAPAAPPPEPRVLRVHDLEVRRLTARVVHARELHASTGSVGVVLPSDPDSLLQLELGPQNLKVDELTVDVLFAHDIKAGWIHVDEAHAHVKIDKADD